MSPGVVPPPYVSTASPGDVDLKKLADDHVKTISDMDPATIQRELNTTLDSEKTKKLIDTQIRRLAEKTLNIRAAFEKIGILLGSFDSMGFRDVQNNAIEALRPGWEILRNSYNLMLEESHKNAIMIKAVCDEYIRKILGVLEEEGMSMADIKLVVQDFIERTNEKTGASKTASEYAKGFDTLRTDVNGYHETIKQAFEQAVTDPEGEITFLTRKIQDLQAQIAEQQAHIDRCISIINAAVENDVTSVLFSFIPVIGAAAAEALLARAEAGNAKVVKENEMQRSKDEIKAAESKLVDLQAREETLKKLCQEFVNSESSFSTIISQLAGLANFWTAIKADCLGAIIHLENAHKAKRVYGFKKDLGQKLGGSAYIALSHALAVYVSQLTELISDNSRTPCNSENVRANL